ncbi:MAG: hypothetical protein EBZ68_06525 [Actinobacteria bacterium]|nr:hypothetical protein [Actinomycetota bacterium]
MGMFLLVLGVLLSLSVYVSVVGPVGRGLDTSLRWTVGLGRYVLPIVCLGLGVALLKRVSIEHRVRLTFGWLVVSIALLGVMHVFLAANELTVSLGALEGAGGWLGWLIGEPLEASLSPVGAVVILAPTILHRRSHCPTSGVRLARCLRILIQLLAVTAKVAIDHSTSRPMAMLWPASTSLMPLGANTKKPRRVARSTTMRAMVSMTTAMMKATVTSTKVNENPASPACAS